MSAVCGGGGAADGGPLAAEGVEEEAGLKDVA